MIQAKNIYIVTGIGNIIGKEFMRYYSYNDDDFVIGIKKQALCDYDFSYSIETSIDLTSPKQIYECLGPIFSRIDWNCVQSCIIIHTAGKAKNELPGMPIIDHNNDGIDDEMYASQITTFDHLHEYIVNYLFQEGCLQDIKMTIVALGSLIDKHPSPIHHSMRTLNNMMRDALSRLAFENKNYHCVMISVSTVATATEIFYRKHADQSYWLTGVDVVDKSVEIIDCWENKYQDIEVYKRHPLFEKYFKHETLEQRIERFKKEIGIA